MSEEIVTFNPEDAKVITQDPIKKVESKSLSDIAPVQSDINIDPKEKPKQEPTKINYRDKNYLKSILDQPTEKPGGEDNKGNSDAKSRLLNDTPTDSGSSSTASSEESKTTAGLIVELLDWMLVALITWWSKDKSDKDYVTDKAKKDILKKYLGEYLVKKQAAYPVEFFLIFGFLSVYVISGIKANSKRKTNLEIEKEEKATKQREREERQQRSTGKKRSIKDDVNVEKVWQEGEATVIQ